MKYAVLALSAAAAFSSHVAFAMGLVPVGWTPVTSQTGYPAYIAPPNTGSGSRMAANLIWESAVGSAKFSSSNSLNFASGTATVVTKGAVSAAGLFGAVRTVVGLGTGPVLLTLTALQMAPMIKDYFFSDRTRLGPASGLESATPFEMRSEVSYLQWTSPHGIKPFQTALAACHSSYPASTFPTLVARTLSSTSANCETSSGSLAQVYATVQPGLGPWMPAGWNDIKPVMDATNKAITPAQVQEVAKYAPVPIFYPAENAAFFPPGTLSIAGPASISGNPLVSRVESETKITTTTKTPTTDLTYSTPADPVTGKPAPTVSSKPGERVVVTELDKASGVTKVISTTTTESAPAVAPAPQEKIIVCGLPDTPPCKIDETGTKLNSGTTFDQTKTDIDTQRDAAKAEIDKAAQIQAPLWTFSFNLPTGCSPFPTGIRGIVIDMCQYQGTIHSLMSMIWAGATAFCLIGMVGRTIRES